MYFQIYCILHTEGGNSSPLLHLKNDLSNAFRKKQRDTFLFSTYDLRDIGKITMIELWVKDDTKGQWFADLVVAVNHHRDNEMIIFPVHRFVHTYH